MRGGSMITAVSAAAKAAGSAGVASVGRPAKICAASPAWKVTFGRLFAVAFSRAKRMEDSLSSMPATRVNDGAAVRAKRPLPQ